MMKPRRLGRGLDFLLQGAAAAAPAEEAEAPLVTPHDIGLDEITANPWQPRTQFDEAGLQELTESIRTHGILQPLVVRPRAAGGYELVAGERRMIAAKRAGLTRLPVVVRDVPDEQMLMVALIENVQRRDLNPLERARAFRRLVDDHQLSHERVADLAGMARSTVSNSLRLLELGEDHRNAISNGTISEGHARALLSEPDLARRDELFKAIVEQRWNVRATESAALKPSAKKSARSPDATRLAASLREKLGTKVTIVERGQRGRIVVEYSSLKEFERLYERLAGEPPSIE